MLNLEAKTKPQKLILAYLEKNATEELIEKINNGVRIEKDGKQLISKKTLDGFMSYANSEARKLAEKGATSACVEDAIVYGWAMHYFEEDSIEGTLYNLDGTEYKPVIKAKNTQKPTYSPTFTKTKEESKQPTLFDLVSEESKTKEPEKPTIDEILDYNIDEDHDNDEDEDMSEEMKDAIEHIEAEKQTQKIKPTIIPFYQQYLDLQKEHPTAIVLMRLGDFYEVFGDNAPILADELSLTLTSRDVGLPERIPMIGFPYHAADNYFLKIHSKHDMLVCETDGDTTFLPIREKKADAAKHWIDETTYVDDDGIIHEVKEEVKKQIPDWLVKTFNNKIIAR